MTAPNDGRSNIDHSSSIAPASETSLASRPLERVPVLCREAHEQMLGSGSHQLGPGGIVVQLGPA